MINLLLTVHQYGRHDVTWKPAIDKLSAFAGSHEFNSFSILSYNEYTFPIFTSCFTLATRFQTPFIWYSVQAPRIHIHSFTTNYNNISYMLESINCVHDGFVFLIEKPFLFLWEGFIASHSVWIHWSPRTTKTWLIILLSFSGTPHEFKGIKMLPSC